jgi:hypothetical protein
MTLIPGQSSCNSRLLKRLSEIAVASHLHLLRAEERLDACWDSREPNAYSVEVSGWGNNEDFFVEKTELHWSEQSGKHILLLRPIASGALVFLRLIDPTSVDRVHPVAYRAELFDMTEAGQLRVRLLAAWPG